MEQTPNNHRNNGELALAPIDHDGPVRIAVVGMGAMGVAVCIQFIQRLTSQSRARKLELHTFEKQGHIGAGVAYRTMEDCHLLNMRAGTMSLHRDKPDDFANWLCERHADPAIGVEANEGARDAYVPRRLFGEYARDRLKASLHIAERNHLKVIHHQLEVTDCHDYGRYVMLKAGNQTKAFDYVVLCLGDLPSTKYEQYRPLQKYLHSPWDYRRYDEINKNAAIGILGTSLTAVDVLLLLNDRNHRGSIGCFARKRSLPKVQGPRMAYQLRYITQKRLRELTQGYTRHLTYPEVQDLFRGELLYALGGTCDWPTVFRRPSEDVRNTLAHDIAEAEKGRTVWYSVLDATSEIILDIWRHTEYCAKAKFMYQHESIWAMYRYCMPLPNARKLLAMAEADRLLVCTGLENVSYDRRRDQFALVCSNNGQSHCHWVDYLINATGTEFSLERLQSPLLQSMVHRGQLSGNPLGGVDVDFGTLQVKHPGGMRSERIYFVGPLTKGVHFYTNSVETNLANAERVTKYLSELITDKAPGIRKFF